MAPVTPSSVSAVSPAPTSAPASPWPRSASRERPPANHTVNVCAPMSRKVLMRCAAIQNARASDGLCATYWKQHQPRADCSLRQHEDELQHRRAPHRVALRVRSQAPHAQRHRQHRGQTARQPVRVLDDGRDGGLARDDHPVAHGPVVPTPRPGARGAHEGAPQHHRQRVGEHGVAEDLKAARRGWVGHERGDPGEQEGPSLTHFDSKCLLPARLASRPATSLPSARALAASVHRPRCWIRPSTGRDGALEPAREHCPPARSPARDSPESPRTCAQGGPRSWAWHAECFIGWQRWG